MIYRSEFAHRCPAGYLVHAAVLNAGIARLSNSRGVDTPKAGKIYFEPMTVPEENLRGFNLCVKNRLDRSEAKHAELRVFAPESTRYAPLTDQVAHEAYSIRMMVARIPAAASALVRARNLRVENR
jgi:hypothetical protein